MPVRSRALGGVTSMVPNGTVTIFEVPAGRTAIVRQWTFANRSGVARLLVVSVRKNGVNLNVARVPAVAHNATAGEPDCNLVINPGDALVAFIGNESSSGDCHFYAAGSLLLGEPE